MKRLFSDRNMFNKNLTRRRQNYPALVCRKFRMVGPVLGRGNTAFDEAGRDVLLHVRTEARANHIMGLAAASPPSGAKTSFRVQSCLAAC